MGDDGNFVLWCAADQRRHARGRMVSSLRAAVESLMLTCCQILVEAGSEEKANGKVHADQRQYRRHTCTRPLECEAAWNED